MTRPCGVTCSSLRARVAQHPVLDLEDRAEPVGVRLVRAEEAEVRRRGVARVDVAQQLAERARRLRARGRRSAAPQARRRPDRAGRAATSTRPPLACGSAPIRRSPRGASAASSRRERAGGVEALLRAGSCAASARAARGARGSRARPPAGPGGSETSPRPGVPSTSCGPVQPFGVRSTIAGQRGVPRAVRRRRCGRRRWIARISRVGAVERGGEVAMHLRGSSPATIRGRVAVAAQQREERRPRASRPSTVGPAILCSLRCRIGSTAPSCAGSRKRIPFHEPSSGAVSASPSPMTQATSRSGLSNAAPKACTSA